MLQCVRSKVSKLGRIGVEDEIMAWHGGWLHVYDWYESSASSNQTFTCSEYGTMLSSIVHKPVLKLIDPLALLKQLIKL